MDEGIVEIKSWECWLVTHRKAAKMLMAELPANCTVLTPINQKVVLTADAFLGNPYVAGRLLEVLVTRERAEAILRGLGYELRDIISDDITMLQLCREKKYSQFRGVWRWTEALRFALETWEGEQ